VVSECSLCTTISLREARQSLRWAFVSSHAPITRWTYPNFLEPCDERISYGNHSGDANTLDSRLGFDIAIRDLASETELTFDYRRLCDPTFDFECHCGNSNCAGRIRCLQAQPELEEFWKSRIAEALQQLTKVDQLLLKTTGCGTIAALPH
jgi:hypothetical protein